MELRKYVSYFEDEINFDSFSNFGDMVSKLLILFKLKCDVSLKVDDVPLRVCYNPTEHPGQNCIIIEGSDLFVSEETKDKAISEFLNSGSHSEAFKSEVEVYVDVENKITQLKSKEGDLEINYMNNRLIGLIISKLIPWHFNVIKADDPNQDAPGLNKDVFVMISKLTNSNDTSLTEMLMEEIRAHGIDNEIFMKNLEDLGNKLMERRTADARENIRREEQRLRDYIRNVAEVSENLRRSRETLKAIELGEADTKAPITEMMNLIKYSPENVVVDDFENSWLKLSFSVPMENFETDEYEAYIVNNRGTSYFFYSGDADSYDEDTLRKFYKEIFDTRRFKVFFNSGMKVNLETGDLQKHASSHPHANTMKHPHLDMGYFCHGNTGTYVAQYIAESAYAEAVTLVIQSAKQFSISDSIIGEKFVNGLFEYKCIQMPNGEFMNASQAITYMKEHEEEFND